MLLCMDKKVVEAFNDISSATKAAFTRIFNQENKDDLVGKKGKKSTGGAKTSKEPQEDENEEEEEEEDKDQLIEED